MTCTNSVAAAGCLRSDQIVYCFSPATISSSEAVHPVHLIASGEGVALTYGSKSLEVGAGVMLTVGAKNFEARVGWSDGARARLDTL